MALERLTARERFLLGQCLSAAAEGPFFDDDDGFDTIFGVSLEEVAEVAHAWPHVDDNEEIVELVINNAVANLLGYPHGRMKDWPKFISAPPGEIRRVLSKWRRLKGWDDPERQHLL
ncbi:hypothetical protein [Deinococcus planocerae]|uniref:hypothetical protein n=1 Tax=Deinococcus planocerae TaxID=1737569 RepID=UPI0011AF8975|nr:hypothetical protein [Deinococcus planocerae]